MSATIEYRGRRIRLQGGIFTTDDPDLVEICEAMVPWDQDRPDYDPHPDLTIAEAVAHKLGGRVVDVEPPEIDPDAIY
jgi:hypothetical protein